MVSAAPATTSTPSGRTAPAASHPARRGLRRRGADPVRQGRRQGPVRADPRRRPGRQGDPGTAAAPARTAAGTDRRGGHRRRHPDRRPGPDHRPQRGHPGRAPPVGARLRHRPDVRRRDDRRHHRRLRHRRRRLRRRHRRRGRAHGPPPDGRGRRPQPAFRRRPAGRPVRADDGLDRGEPARPLPAADQGAGRRVRGGQPGEVRQGAGQRQDRTRPGAGGHPLGRAGLGTGRCGRNAPPRNDSRRPGRPCAHRSGRTAG